MLPHRSPQLRDTAPNTSQCPGKSPQLHAIANHQCRSLTNNPSSIKTPSNEADTGTQTDPRNDIRMYNQETVNAPYLGILQGPCEGMYVNNPSEFPATATDIDGLTDAQVDSMLSYMRCYIPSTLEKKREFLIHTAKFISENH